MKGVDEFVWVLIIAVIALAVFAVVGLYIGGPGAGPGPAASNYTLMGNFSLGRVGYTGSSPIRTESIGSFTAGEPQIENMKSVADLRVATSLIGMERGEYIIGVEEGVLPEVREARISFDVDETNLYGNLVIKWNGKEVFRKGASPGHYSLTIEKEAVKAANRLEIYAEGPGALFWASTLYAIKDFRVNKVSGLAKIWPFSLGSGELQVFDRGEISFELGERGPGKLLIKVNGITVYNKEPKLEEKVGFTYADVPFLKAGNNLLVFSAENGSFRIVDAELGIYSLTNTQVRKRGFEMDSDMLEDFGMGVLEFRVGRIVKDGGLEIKINGEYIEVGEIRGGINRITFGKDMLKEGNNDVEFSGTGAFDITEVTIGFEK